MIHTLLCEIKRLAVIMFRMCLEGKGVLFQRFAFEAQMFESIEYLVGFICFTR